MIWLKLWSITSMVPLTFSQNCKNNAMTYLFLLTGKMQFLKFKFLYLLIIKYTNFKRIPQTFSYRCTV